MDNPLYFALKCVLALSTLVFLVWQLWQLRHWQRQFVLNGNGEGRFSNGEDFRLLRRTWVTPFVCLIYYESQGKAHLLPLWADMLSDTDYRHLCRLLLKAKSGEPT